MSEFNKSGLRKHWADAKALDAATIKKYKVEFKGDFGPHVDKAVDAWTAKKGPECKAAAKKALEVLDQYVKAIGEKVPNERIGPTPHAAVVRERLIKALNTVKEPLMKMRDKDPV